MSDEPKVYIDACCFIDMVSQDVLVGVRPGRESHVYYCRKFLEAARNKEANVFTSTLTVAECTHVKDESDRDNFKPVLTDEVKRLFEGMLLSAKSGVMPVQPTPRIVKAARDLRWKYGAIFGPMDSLHIATAIEMKCEHFLTTDGPLKKPSNVKILNDLGLIPCTADQISTRLPSKYLQLALHPMPSKEVERQTV